MLARHADEVPGSNASALVVAEIDIPLHDATEEVGLEVLRVVLVKSGSLRDVAAAVGGNLEFASRAATLGEGGSDVVGLLLTVKLDLDGIETVELLLHVEQIGVFHVLVGLG